jgi:hypothetical protein
LNILGHFGPGVKYRNSNQPKSGSGWPMHNGQTANLTQEEFENIEHGLNVQVRVFDLNNEKDLEAYTEIRDKVANKRYIQLDRTKLISSDGLHIKVHMEWADVEGYINQSNRRR